MRIFLADLGHNLLTISSDVYLLGVADLAAYLQAYAKTKKPLEITVFREPQDLKAAIDKAPPDVLGVSSYAWNHNLSRNFARYVKARSQTTVTVLGGPNFPLTRGEQEIFLREMPEIDVVIQGPTYEGEGAFLNFGASVDLERHVQFNFVRMGEDVRYSLDDSSLRALGWNNAKTFDIEVKAVVEYYKSRFVW